MFEVSFDPEVFDVIDEHLLGRAKSRVGLLEEALPTRVVADL